jgi:predicted RNase H-like nuclease (RuvC/YqgF family)
MFSNHKEAIMRLDRTTQDWQIEAQEMHSKYNRFIRHQRTIEEMEREVYTWGQNLSKQKNTK